MVGLIMDQSKPSLAFASRIVLISFVFLAITMLIKKEGRFPQTHVSQNRAMRERGIHCVQTQDWQERHRKGLYDDAQRPEHKK